MLRGLPSIITVDPSLEKAFPPGTWTWVPDKKVKIGAKMTLFRENKLIIILKKLWGKLILMSCPLCERDVLTRKYFEDDICWVVDCFTCKAAHDSFETAYDGPH